MAGVRSRSEYCIAAPIESIPTRLTIKIKMDVFISEEYMVKRRMEKRAAAASARSNVVVNGQEKNQKMSKKDHSQLPNDQRALFGEENLVFSFCFSP
ncbi:hypothetical protein E3N88_26961 [Mikania micrantha]|uniref:Uncharacterized protein n=1 Tax=Mikania micrantha TaxID=192012 RepID=A0A5N6MWF7_9ASTR|nr:hypothetical protein E3N88_26961 [Mikania micrantha]